MSMCDEVTVSSLSCGRVNNTDALLGRFGEGEH